MTCLHPCYDLFIHGQTTQNIKQNYWHVKTPRKIIKGWTTHTPIDNKTHKIIVGRIIWSISNNNNDNPHELQIDNDNISQYMSIYHNIFNIDYDLLQILNPINICWNSSKWCETQQSTVSNQIRTKLPFKRM